MTGVRGIDRVFLGFLGSLHAVLVEPPAAGFAIQREARNTGANDQHQEGSMDHKPHSRRCHLCMARLQEFVVTHDHCAIVRAAQNGEDGAKPAGSIDINI